ncbi:hypothetical protein O9H85_00670 [Paenibacillus filicis]|uniref:Uncharacterized protein n=1 Tax=Paenibacillus gyeongsangnamensis TaxID=3388067 RepID=A0ABT4Q2P2_9BACL|nr:hypothetical protein [Paenibacillus filicis]MCZ8510970.1 hypothetical protein [Paenibacillus filicis]
MAYKAADLSAYIIAKQMEAVCDNPLQSTELQGVMLVNTSGETQYGEVKVPENFSLPRRQFAATHVRDFLPYGQEEQKYRSYGTIELAPFSWKKIPLAELEVRQNTCTSNKIAVTEGVIETTYYRMTYQPVSGCIVQLCSFIFYNDSTQPIKWRMDGQNDGPQCRTF